MEKYNRSGQEVVRYCDAWLRNPTTGKGGDMRPLPHQVQNQDGWDYPDKGYSYGLCQRISVFANVNLNKRKYLEDWIP